MLLTVKAVQAEWEEECLKVSTSFIVSTLASKRNSTRGEILS